MSFHKYNNDVENQKDQTLKANTLLGSSQLEIKPHLYIIIDFALYIYMTETARVTVSWPPENVDYFRKKMERAKKPILSEFTSISLD